MNAYTFDDIAIGHTETFEFSVSEEKMDTFLKLTNDTNPLHIDSTYARQNGFNSRVAYGMLSASFLSTFAGVYLPGKFCLLHEVAIGFLKPVYVGDMLKITGKVIEKQEAYKQITIKVAIENTGGGGVKPFKIAKGHIKAGVLH